MLFLFHLFARCFLLAKTFDMDCMTKNLSQMMGSTCEAFAVIDYAKNYVTWVNECKQEMGEEVSEVTASGWLAQQGLLGGAQGKYRGWSGEGMELYHRIVELLDEHFRSNTAILLITCYTHSNSAIVDQSIRLIGCSSSWSVRQPAPNHSC